MIPQAELDRFFQILATDAVITTDVFFDYCMRTYRTGNMRGCAAQMAADTGITDADALRRRIAHRLS